MSALLRPMIASVVAAGVMAAGPVHSQEYPTRPVRLVAGNVGSTADFVARFLGQRLAERWGKPVVIDNRRSILGAEHVISANPDGHTLLMGQLSSHAAAPHIYKMLSYDPVRDFAPVALGTLAPLVLVAQPSIPAKNLRDFVAYARHRTGGVLCAAQSGASNGRLTMELFKRATGLEMLYVPYKSPSASANALLAQEAQVSFLTMPVVLPHVNTGRLNAYAVTSSKRFGGAPEIPTMAEAGLPGVESLSWFGVFAPARTPRALVQNVNRNIVAVLRAPGTHTALWRNGMEPAAGTPEEFATFLKSEIAKWGQIIKDAGIRAE